MEKKYTSLLSAALADLVAAIDKLRKDTVPWTKMPRVRKFEFVTGHIIWPANDIRHIMVKEDELPINDDIWREFVSRKIIETSLYRPRLILRALRRIQAATAWCEARTEGRQRAAEEILRQQQKAAEVLEAEAAMLAWGVLL